MSAAGFGSLSSSGRPSVREGKVSARGKKEESSAFAGIISKFADSMGAVDLEGVEASGVFFDAFG